MNPAHTKNEPNTQKVGIAGIGAIGSAVARALTLEPYIHGLKLHMISDPVSKQDFHVPNVDFETLVRECDIIVECLPAHIVPSLAPLIFKANKDAIFISSAALLLYPEIMEAHQGSSGQIYVPSGALSGLDAVKAMKQMGIIESKIASTKPPKGFTGAPYIVENQIDLESITEKTRLFEGNALEASRGFPANINVAASLSLAGIGAQNTRVEIWADPHATGNAHEITVRSKYSTLTSRIENMPDPANPKSSVLAAQSIVATLRDLHGSIIIG